MSGTGAVGTHLAIKAPDFTLPAHDGSLRPLDDGTMGSPTARTPELIEAMRAIAHGGDTPAIQHPAMGCSIKMAALTR